MNFHEAPLLVFWESTKACPLSCKHCRADAILKPLKDELNTDEAKLLIKQISEFSPKKPLLIITGGDCLMRADIFELIEYANNLNVPVSLSPAVSEKLNIITLKEIKKLKVRSISVSLDGAKPETHEYLRGVKGSFERTIFVIKTAINIGLEIQVNTLIWRKNILELPDIVHLLNQLNVKIWEVFFLILTGRANKDLDIEPVEYEVVLNFLVDVSTYSIQVRTVEAPFYRRVKLQRINGKECYHPLYIELKNKLISLMGKPKNKINPYVLPTRDGYGIIFVSYNGNVYPSGFLPYPLGNIKNEHLVNIYRNHPILLKMREGAFKGRCGICEYKNICGGSRARAYAYYNDILAEDPACLYLLGG
jgi:AdoMet-dependent heme synthase